MTTRRRLTINPPARKLWIFGTLRLASIPIHFCASLVLLTCNMCRMSRISNISNQ